MTLPRNKSRAIAVDGTSYRWMGSRVDHEFSMLVRVEHAAGQGQCLVLKRRDVYGTDRVPPVTPRYVAAAIRHARALGWEPTVPGRDFPLDSSQLDRPRRPLPTGVPPAGTTALWSRVDLDPLRASFPWKHHDPNLFVEFRLSATPSDKALGSLFAHLARTHNLAPGSRPALLLEALSRLEVDDHECPFDISGGIEVLIDGKDVLRHGCCVTIGEWIQWRELLRSGREPWNGHDPFSTAMLEGDTVQFVDPDQPDDPPPSVSRACYEQMLAGLEQDLRGFVRNAEQWVSARVSADVTEALIGRLATSMAIDRVHSG